MTLRQRANLTLTVRHRNGDGASYVALCKVAGMSLWVSHMESCDKT